MEALRADMMFLRKLWEAIEGTAKRANGGELVHEDLPLPLRVLRDLLSPEIERVRVDSEAEYARIKEFADRFIPQMSPKIELYTEENPIFDLYGIDDEIDRALKRKVSLKSGGHVVFDQTEAMTTIDVNTGAYVGHRNLEETIFRTNLEAAVSIARQLRLRNLAARARGNDAQTQSREPGTRAMPSLSKLRGAGLRQNAGNRVLRDISRDSPPASPVRFPGIAGSCAPRSHRTAAGRGVDKRGRARRGDRQADSAPK
jgi:ribonuclease G